MESMNDATSAALIGALAAVGVTFITQYLTVLSANKQRDHQERVGWGEFTNPNTAACA